MSALPCTDGGPWRCTEAGCPADLVSCAHLKGACNAQFERIWSEPPPGLAGSVWKQCRATCGRCTGLDAQASVVESLPEAGGAPRVAVYDEVLPRAMIDDLASAMGTRQLRKHFSQAWLRLPEALAHEPQEHDLYQSVIAWLLARTPELSAEAWECVEFFWHTRWQDTPFQTHFDAAESFTYELQASGGPRKTKLPTLSAILYASDEADSTCHTAIFHNQLACSVHEAQQPTCTEHDGRLIPASIRHSTLVQPRYNRLMVMEGDWLHGILPCARNLSAPRKVLGLTFWRRAPGWAERMDYLSQRAAREATTSPSTLPVLGSHAAHIEMLRRSPPANLTCAADDAVEESATGVPAAAHHGRAVDRSVALSAAGASVDGAGVLLKVKLPGSVRPSRDFWTSITLPAREHLRACSFCEAALCVPHGHGSSTCPVLVHADSDAGKDLVTRQLQQGVALYGPDLSMHQAAV